MCVCGWGGGGGGGGGEGFVFSNAMNTAITCDKSSLRHLPLGGGQAVKQPHDLLHDALTGRLAVGGGGAGR